jgi:tetratricopeptide (TPR) repeat protein
MRPPPPPPPLATRHQPGDGPDLLAAHTDLRAAHGRLDNLLGASAVHDQALAHHRQVTAWHDRTRPGPDRRRIAALAADIGGFTGFLAYDLGDCTGAALAYRQAAELAADADDISLCANLLGQLSRTAGDSGHHTEALRLATAALATAGTAAHPAVRSWLHAVRSTHHAARADAPAAHADLHTAWSLLPRADDGAVPSYIGYLSEAELHKWTTHTLSQLGAHAPALTAATQARTGWPDALVRGSAEMLAAAAGAHLATGDLDQAVTVLARAASVASATGSTRNLGRVMRVRGALTPHRADRQVRELDEFLLTGLPHRHPC